jgi:hypothetical protein
VVTIQEQVTEVQSVQQADLAASSSSLQHSLQPVNPFESVEGFVDLPSHPPKPTLRNQFRKRVFY